jgi:hypothetical protein
MSDPMVLTSTRVLEVCSILITGLSAATGISRAFITTGEIAVDSECGTLGLSFQSGVMSTNYPVDKYPMEWNQRPGIRVFNMRVEAWRCAPVVGDVIGNTPDTPPTVGQLTAVAAQVLSDEYVIWHYLECTLGNMYSLASPPQTIANYLIQGSTPLGPQGGQQGVAINFSVGFSRECSC